MNRQYDWSRSCKETRFKSTEVCQKTKMYSPLKYALLATSSKNLMEVLTDLGHYEPKCLIHYVKEYPTSSSSLDYNEINKCAKIPRPSSSVIIEMVKRKDDRLVVRVNYDGKYIDVCKLDNKYGSHKFDCPYEKWVLVTTNRKYYRHNFEMKCYGHLITPYNEKATSFSGTAWAVFIVFLVLVIVALFNSNRNKSIECRDLANRYNAETRHMNFR